MTDLNGRWALVTGASSGLGADFARELAVRGCKLVLVARREDRLKLLASELAGAETRVVPLDLRAPDAAKTLYERLRAEGVGVDVLVNNAGFGLYGPFVASEWNRQRDMLELDVVALTHLTHVFARGMAERGAGWVLLVASIGAFQPTPTYATYSAAKAYVLSFGEALAAELRPRGVRVCTTCPGVTATEFLAVAGQKRSLYQRLFMMQSPDVVRSSVRALLARRTSVVPGIGNKVAAFSMRFTPRRLQAAMAASAMTMGAGE